MTYTSVRQAHGEEMLDILYWLLNYSLGESPPLPDEDKWKKRISQRDETTCFLLFEHHDPVASVVSSPMTQNVRGKLFSMAGIWGVATHPKVRRKGYCRQLMTELLRKNRQDGRPLSCLYPFRESFYERMGYVTFPLTHTAKFAPSALLPLLQQNLRGKVEIELIGKGYDIYRQYICDMRERVHGMGMFDKPEAPSSQESRSWIAQAKVDGNIEGLMLYELRGEDVTEFTLRATRFYYRTSLGKYLLLSWLARHTDQAGQIELWLPSYEQPETWLSDIKVSTESAPRAPMGRIIDLQNIGGMETKSGSFSAEISDPLCPWNEGIWQLETVNGQLQVSKGDQAEFTLTIHALTGLIYGTHDPNDFAIRGWGDPTIDVQDIMRKMFPPLQPYMHEYF